MSSRSALFTAGFLLSSALYAEPDLSGIWMLNLPDAESELFLSASALAQRRLA